MSKEIFIYRARFAEEMFTAPDYVRIKGEKDNTYDYVWIAQVGDITYWTNSHGYSYLQFNKIIENNEQRFNV